MEEVGEWRINRHVNAAVEVIACQGGDFKLGFATGIIGTEMSEIRCGGTQDGEEVREAEVPVVVIDELVGKCECDKVREESSVPAAYKDRWEEEGAPYLAKSEVKVYDVRGVQEEEFDNREWIRPGLG